MFCSRCGQKSDDNEFVCKNCGNLVLDDVFENNTAKNSRFTLLVLEIVKISLFIVATTLTIISFITSKKIQTALTLNAFVMFVALLIVSIVAVKLNPQTKKSKNKKIKKNKKSV